MHSTLREDLNVQLYKIQIVRHIKENGYKERINFSVELLDMTEDNAFSLLLWMSDKANFHLGGSVNKSNCHYLSLIHI